MTDKKQTWMEQWLVSIGWTGRLRFRWEQLKLSVSEWYLKIKKSSQ